MRKSTFENTIKLIFYIPAAAIERRNTDASYDVELAPLRPRLFHWKQCCCKWPVLRVSNFRPCRMLGWPVLHLTQNAIVTFCSLLNDMEKTVVLVFEFAKFIAANATTQKPRGSRYSFNTNGTDLIIEETDPLSATPSKGSNLANFEEVSKIRPELTWGARGCQFA